ncbi:MAG: stalk domain-containing protein [Vallitaleaceae bacterium]|jgi:hypothetical protein|nr:stalk domain-containing protein [Vallitaleaceae bacterium]
MKLKLFIVTLLSLTLLGSSLVLADNGFEYIQSRLDGTLNFLVDGESWYPQDVDGSTLTPIVYNNRTYIPVRSLLEHTGAGVDYIADTRTVVLDFSTVQSAGGIDKSSPVLMTRLSKSSPNNDGVINEATLNFSRNPDYLDLDSDGDGISTSIEYTYDLSSDVTIEVDGKMTDMSLDELVHSEILWALESGGQVDLRYNPDADKAITALSINTTQDDTEEAIKLASIIDIEIEISGPPYVITIHITY